MRLPGSLKSQPWLILSWAVVLFFTLLYLSLIFNDNLLTDEAFTMQLISGSVPEILSGTAGDVHPPLYYLFAKLFNFKSCSFGCIRRTYIMYR